MKSLVYFGVYDPGYARNRILIRGFEEQGYRVTQVRVDPRTTGFIKRIASLYRRGKAARRQNPDLVIVGFPGHSIVWLARLVFGKNFIFDAFLSVYDSNVFDREIYSAWNPKAWKDWIYDWLGFHVPRFTLLDTDEHISYAIGEFGANRGRLIRVLIGADEKIFHPRTRPASEKFIVHFHGMFIPLQGVQHIIEAATVLRGETDIVFNIAGSGQTFKAIQKIVTDRKLSNVNLIGSVPFEKVPEYIAASDVCLGIFGDTIKAKRVIPNKVYECAAMERAIITANTPAIREVFSDGKDVILCSPTGKNVGEAIAEKVLLLKQNKALRDSIAAGGLAAYKAQCTAGALAQRLITDINDHESKD